MGPAKSVSGRKLAVTVRLCLVKVSVVLCNYAIFLMRVACSAQKCCIT